MNLSNAWEVFLIFMIPIGGGIPAGVILAKNKGIQWPEMTLLYFISDVALAFLFEPFVLLMKYAGKKYAFFARLNAAFKKNFDKSIEKYGVSLGPFALIMISFGVDPMTGRTAALAAGHGFITGWLLAIMGDMIFFAVLMISTLCLNNILGDGTMAAIVIMIAMTVVPGLIRRLRQWKQTTR